MANRTVLLIGFLVLVIVILVSVVVFSFWIKPTFSGYVVQKQVDAQSLVYQDILNQVQQNGFFQMRAGNQTLLLAPFNPQQGQQTQQAQPAQQIQQPTQ